VLGVLVHAARSTDVCHVAIDGQLVLKDRQLLTLEAQEVAERAQKHAARIISRANL
jgi:5-methylthioadenosine/S-adenosylhomocysteine deaminase